MKKAGSSEIDRLAPRGRPPGSPLMEQTWANLLFLHWTIDARLLRPLVPPTLELDLFENQAWIGITPFTMPSIRIEGLPEIPGLKSMHELNVRTYVHFRGVPGVWFLSLDASKLIPAIAARVLYALPYYRAAMHFNAPKEGVFHLISSRSQPGGAEFEAIWKEGIELRTPDTESLAFFLTERYALYSADETHLYRARIYHAPWILQDAELLSYRSTLLSSNGLPEPVAPPLLHFARKQNVEVWPSETLI